MKKLFTTSLATLLTSTLLVTGAQAAEVPSIDEIKADIDAFQGFFKKRFPGVALEDYADGVNALPQYAHRRANWEMQQDFPPYEEYFDQGVEEWETPFKNGKTFDSCFEGKPPANEYPYADAAGKIHTVEGDILSCLKANGEEKIKGTSQKMARLTMVYRNRANGNPMAVDFSSEAIRKAYAKGREFYWTKRGQLNFSCADCHVHNSGQSVRGDVLSAGLGHGVGFPVYRTKWGQTAKPLGTIHRRYKGCNSQVRANPMKPMKDEFIALEVYESIMNTGVPVKAPSNRQ